MPQVQTGTTHYHSSETTVVTAALSITAGNAAIVTISQFQSGGVTAPVTSCKLDNTTDMDLDRDTGNFVSGSFNIRISTFSLRNLAAGSHSATAVVSALVTTTHITEASGLTAALADGSARASGTSTTPASGAYTSSATTEFWYGVTAGLFGTPATLVAGSGWAIPVNGSESDGSQWLCSAVETLTNPGTATENAEFTNGTSAFWVALVVAYRTTVNNAMLSVTLGALTCAATATAAVAASGATTLGALTCVATATALVSAQAVVSLGVLTAAATATATAPAVDPDDGPAAPERAAFRSLHRAFPSMPAPPLGRRTVVLVGTAAVRFGSPTIRATGRVVAAGKAAVVLPVGAPTAWREAELAREDEATVLHFLRSL